MPVLFGVLTTALLTLQSAAFEWDHLFIQVDDPEAAVAAFTGAGFHVFPETSVHEGQGTSSRAVLFDNGYIELIWVRDAAELRAADPILAERMSGLPAFGVALNASDPEAAIPLETRPYRADWMTPGEPIRFASTREGEPVVFFVPASMAFRSPPDGPSITAMLPHPNGANRVTGVGFAGVDAEPSPAFRWLLEEGFVGSMPGDERVLELEIDGGRAGETLDLTSMVPVRVRY